MPFLSGLWAKLLAVLAVVGTVALAVVKLLGAGAAKQQARQQQAEIAGHHAKETLGYAPAIRKWHLLMEAGR